MLLLAATLHAAPGTTTVELPWAGGTHLRTAPAWGGHRVLVEPRVDTLDTRGALLRSAGTLPTYTAALEPLIDVDGALDRARALVDRPLGLVTIEHAWLPRGTTLHPVYGLEMAVGTVTNRWQLWYDARTGDLLTLGPAVRTAQGRVFPSNPLESNPVEVELAIDGDALTSAYAEAWSCALITEAEGLFEVGSCEELEQLAVADDNGDYLFDPDPGAFDDPFAEVHLFHHVDLMGAWLEDEHGLDIGDTLLVAANLDMTNAFYGDLDGDGRADLAFGQSPEGVDFGYDADVAYHELGHGVVARTAGLGFMRADEYGMDWSPGALNEGTADVFSILLGGDGEMAEYAGTHSGRSGPIRDLNDDRRCPDDLKGEVHADGEILGAMAWNMVQDSRLGPEVVADLFMASLPTWGTNTTWVKAGEKLSATATDLANELVISTEQELAILEHLEEANLPGCGRVTDLSDGEPRQLYLPNLGLMDDYELVPAGTGFLVDVPDDATTLTILC
ncbi:MAG: M4 family metallopeptidase, partial [Actinomycetia bacterium]|nr:M4 family metallopeptidase [Actinomycetes bacterium]